MACCLKDRRQSWLCMRRDVGIRTKQVSQRLGKGLKGLWDETKSHVEKVVNEHSNNNSTRRMRHPGQSGGSMANDNYFPKRPATMLTAFSHLTLLFLADGRGGQHRTGQLPTSFFEQRVRGEQQPVLPLHEIRFQDEEDDSEELFSVSFDSTTINGNNKGVVVTADYPYDYWADDAQAEERAIKSVLDGSIPLGVEDDNERELVESWEDFFFPFGPPNHDHEESLQVEDVLTRTTHTQSPAFGTELCLEAMIEYNNDDDPLLAIVPDPWDDDAPSPPKMPSRIPFGGTSSCLVNNKDQDHSNHSPGCSLSLDSSQCSNLSSSSSYASSSSNQDDGVFHTTTTTTIWRDDETIVPFRSFPTLFPYHIPSGGSLPGRYHSDSTLSADQEGAGGELSFEGRKLQLNDNVPSHLLLLPSTKSHMA